MNSDKFSTIIFDFNGVIHDRSGLDEEILAYINKLHKQYTIALLTSFSSSELAAYLPTEKRSYFDEIFTRDRLINDKPAPAVFVEVAKKLEVDSENCLVVDDSFANIQGATQAGLTALHYSSIDDVITVLGS